MCYWIGSFVVGSLSGVLGALLGIGGGTVIVPLLVIFFGVEIHLAVAVSLISVIATGFSSSINNITKNTTNIYLAILLEISTSLGAVGGSFLAVSINKTMLMIIFSVSMFATSYIMFKKKENPLAYRTSGDTQLDNINHDFSYFDEALKKDVHYVVEKTPLVMLASSFGGFLSGMLGIGGGVVKVPAINLIGKVPIRAASATSAFMVAITASVGAFVYLEHGYINPLLATSLSLGAIVGSQIGAKIMYKLKGQTLKVIFACFLFIIAIEMLTKALV